MKKPMSVVVLLAMVLAAIVPALAQYGEFDVIPAEEESVSTCAWGPTGVSSPENPYAPNALGPSAHVPGEFVATYESVDAMWAALQDFAKSTTNNWGSYYADTGTVYYPISSGTQVLASLPVPRLLACRRILAG